jgi:hypothetical protein
VRLQQRKGAPWLHGSSACGSSGPIRPGLIDLYKKYHRNIDQCTSTTTLHHKKKCNQKKSLFAKIRRSFKIKVKLVVKLQLVVIFQWNVAAYQVNVTADYNMDLVIALEMSRLQMIEDEMKQRQQNQEHKWVNWNIKQISRDIFSLTNHHWWHGPII